MTLSCLFVLIQADIDADIEGSDFGKFYIGQNSEISIPFFVVELLSELVNLNPARVSQKYKKKC